MLTGEQYLALLPPEAPRSRSIFTTGFYFNGKGLIFRKGLWAMLIPPAPPALILLMLVFPKGLLLAFAVSSFKKGNPTIGILLCILAFMDNMLCFLDATWSPIEFDLNNKIVKYGRFRILQIPFAKINGITIEKWKEFVRGRGEGTQIGLNYDLNNYVSVTSIRTWEEELYTEIIKNSLMHILGKNLKVKYFLDFKLIKESDISDNQQRSDSLAGYES